MHDVDIADLDLLSCLNDIEGEGGGAGDGARHGAAHKIGAEIRVRAQAPPQALKERPVQRREGNVSQQGSGVAAPQTSVTENRFS